MKTIHCIVVICNLLAVGIVRGEDFEHCDDKQMPIEVKDTDPYTYPYLVMITAITPRKEYEAPGFIINRLWVTGRASLLYEWKTYGIAGPNRTTLPANFLTPIYPAKFLVTHPKFKGWNREYRYKYDEYKYDVLLMKLARPSSEIIDPAIDLRMKPGALPPDTKILEIVYWKHDADWQSGYNQEGGFKKVRFYFCPKLEEFRKKCQFKTPPYLCLSTSLTKTDLESEGRAYIPCHLYNTYTVGGPLVAGNQVIAMLLGTERSDGSTVYCNRYGPGPIQYWAFIHLSTVVSKTGPEELNNDVAVWIDETLKKYAPPVPARPLDRNFTEISFEATTVKSTRRRPTNIYYKGFCELNKEERPSTFLFLNFVFAFLITSLF